jgi:hypothetical protein
VVKCGKMELLKILLGKRPLGMIRRFDVRELGCEAMYCIVFIMHSSNPYKA